jgi:outer membrane protein TolC
LATALSAQDAPYQPPTFSYGEGRIGLLEAVRLTLAHDPNLLLDREDVRFQQGVLQELSGQFDWNLSLDVNYDYREQELRDSVRQREQEKRNDLAAQRDFSCAEADRRQQQLDDLIAFAGGDTTVELPRDVAVQVEFLDTLIANEDNPVQRQALVDARANVLQGAIEQGTEGVAELDGLCTDLTDSFARLGEAPEFEEFAQARFALGLSKLFRSGVILSPFVTAGYDHTQFPGKRNGFFEDRLDENGNPVLTEFGTPLRRFVDFGGKNVEDLYRAEIGFDLNVPLLRGRGVETVAAQERAAEVDLEASGYVARHGAALSTLSTALAYWQLYAAQERVTVLEHSLELQTTLLGLTDQLIEGSVLPRVERARSLASQANSRSQLEGARRDLISARLALARAMGVNVQEEGNAPLAEGPFPTPPTVEEIRALDEAGLGGDAVGLRYDRLAARRIVDSGLILTEGARRDLADRFDVAFSLSAGALGEKSFSNAIDRWAAPNGSLGFAYEHVFGNNARLGRLGQVESLVRQREISAADLERQIRIGVVQTVRSLEEAVARLASAEESARYFQETIDAEQEKLKLGASTLIDVIVTEQQKTSADLTLVQARQQVAALLAQLRFETGTLISPDDGGGTVSIEALTELPAAGASAGGRP